MVGVGSRPDSCLGPAGITNSRDSHRYKAVSVIFGSGRKLILASSLPDHEARMRTAGESPPQPTPPPAPSKPEEPGDLRSLSPSCVWGEDQPNESSEKYFSGEEPIGHTWESDLFLGHSEVPVPSSPSRNPSRRGGGAGVPFLRDAGIQGGLKSLTRTDL